MIVQPPPADGRPTLSALAKKHGSDKGPWDPEKKHGHGYAYHYEREFARFRDVFGVLLEVGVLYGASLRCWSEWFSRKMRIVGLDVQVFPQTRIPEDGRTFFELLNVRDDERLGLVVRKHGPFSIVIDDGSHLPADQERTFEALWPHVRPGGLYVIEDWHSSFFPDALYEGTLVPFLRERAEDCLGRGKFAPWSGYQPEAPPTARELEIASIRIFRNLVFFERAGRVPDQELGYQPPAVERKAP